jgi:DtxR family manganese transport transcriptional regulator
LEHFVRVPSERSAPHRRTRRDHKTETAEDYVEAIAELLGERSTCRLTDLASRFSVSHVTAHRIVERLQHEGLIITEPYQPITLTPAGKRLAAKCRERHEIVYRFLLALGVDEQTAAIDAEGIEHHVSPATLKLFRQFAVRLDKPRSPVTSRNG